MRTTCRACQVRPVSELDEMFDAMRAAKSWSEVVTTLLAHGAELRRIEDGSIAVVFRGKKVIRLSSMAGTLPDLAKRLGNMPSALVG